MKLFDRLFGSMDKGRLSRIEAVVDAHTQFMENIRGYGVNIEKNAMGGVNLTAAGGGTVSSTSRWSGRVWLDGVLIADARREGMLPNGKLYSDYDPPLDWVEQNVDGAYVFVDYETNEVCFSDNPVETNGEYFHVATRDEETGACVLNDYTVGDIRVRIADARDFWSGNVYWCGAQVMAMNFATVGPHSMNGGCVLVNIRTGETRIDRGLMINDQFNEWSVYEIATEIKNRPGYYMLTRGRIVGDIRIEVAPYG